MRFETAIVRVSPAAESDGEEGIGKWRIKSTEKEKKIHRDESYDAVVVCNGHYIEPRLAEIPGKFQHLDSMKSFQKQKLHWNIENKKHSHNYRLPNPFKDQVVVDLVVIGSSASAVDISRDISGFAKEVHVASIKQPGYTNIWMHSTIECVHEDGYVVFQNGKTILAHVIMHCTGYKYHFQFLETNGDDNCVGPLNKHIFPPALAPSLSFIGIPYKVLPFPMFKLQSKWISGVLSGRITFPWKEDIMVETKTIYDTFEALGIPKRFTHCLGIDQVKRISVTNVSPCEAISKRKHIKCYLS